MTNFKKWTYLSVIFICASAFAQEVRPAATVLDKDSVYKSHSNKLPDISFFPREKAFWDGYKVTNKNWKLLTDEQKIRFVNEAIEEIKRSETLFVAIPETESLLNDMNAMVNLTEQNSPDGELKMIKILHDLLIQSRFNKEMSNDKTSEIDRSDSNVKI